MVGWLAGWWVVDWLVDGRKKPVMTRSRIGQSVSSSNLLHYHGISLAGGGLGHSLNIPLLALDIP